jgi:hypothetical protein
MGLKKSQTNLGFLLYFIEFQKARIPFRFPSIPFLVSERSETYRVSDKMFRKPKRYSQILLRILNQILRTNGYSEIPLWFSRIRIGFPTVKKGILGNDPGIEFGIFKNPKVSGTSGTKRVF